MLLRKPPRKVMPTFKRSGAGWPRTRETRTRSGPCCSSWIVSKRAMASGLTYDWRVDLVQELRGDRADRNSPPVSRVLGDDCRAIFLQLGNGKAAVLDARDLLEERVVAAGRLCAAFQDVPDDDRACELIPRVARPAEAPDAWPDYQRRVGDPAGDHDVRAVRQRRGDAKATQVGVRRGRRLLKPRAVSKCANVSPWARRSSSRGSRSSPRT